ncbi:MAG: hypothetical protein NPMRth3_630008, partial [Nitrosopumilales archaeon]
MFLLFSILCRFAISLIVRAL